MECKKEQNAQACTCKSVNCKKRGICCECLSGHLGSQSLPACCFPADYDGKGKNFEAFAKAWGL